MWRNTFLDLSHLIWRENIQKWALLNVKINLLNKCEVCRPPDKRWFERATSNTECRRWKKRQKADAPELHVSCMQLLLKTLLLQFLLQHITGCIGFVLHFSTVVNFFISLYLHLHYFYFKVRDRPVSLFFNLHFIISSSYLYDVFL